MSLAIHLSAKNIAEKTGGPFGSAIFKRNVDTGRAELVSVGMNRVVPLHNSTLHGETVAIQLAQGKVKSFALSPELGGEEGTQRFQYELFTSCEPCGETPLASRVNLVSLVCISTSFLYLSILYLSSAYELAAPIFLACLHFMVSFFIVAMW